MATLNAFSRPGCVPSLFRLFSSPSCIPGLFPATLLLSGAAFWPAFGHAAPVGGSVVAGSANIVQAAPARIDVIQQSQRAAIDWHSFSLNPSEHIHFQQPSAQAATLNRVTGPEMSNVFGRLTANGAVFLINPNGILFGKGARVDVGALVASTANIRSDDFMAGRYRFDLPGMNGATIANHGEITAADGGLVALVAPSVVNTGVINARLGKVALASGDAFTLDLYGDRLINLIVPDSLAARTADASGQPLGIRQAGTIAAAGGSVLLTTSTANEALDHVIDMSGIVTAGSVAKRNGDIVLLADSGSVQVSGTLDASGRMPGETGGSIKVLGREVALLPGAVTDVSGDAGGGSALVGGDFQGSAALPAAANTFVSQGAAIAADAISAGDGGKVVVWADGETQYHGSISAQGGANSGHGGLVEVSGKERLLFRGDVAARAPHGAPGTLLLDPENITVGTTGSDTLAGDPSTIKASTVSNVLGRGTSVALSTTTGDISVVSKIDARFPDAPSGAGLTLNAANNVNLGANILTKSGPVAVTARNGAIRMVENAIVYTGDKDIVFRARGDINTQHLVTSGNVDLESTQGNIALGQDLGGTIPLGPFRASANNGEVKLTGLDTTGPVDVFALRNIDINRPIQSGGAITFESRKINLNHNVFTEGKEILFDGEVVINPTAQELVVAFDDGPSNSVQCEITSCKRKLCPECSLNDSETDLILDTVFKYFRFTQVTLKNPQGGVIVKGLNIENDEREDAVAREAALSKLFSLRQITVASEGGNIVFAGPVDRDRNNAFENFLDAFGKDPATENPADIENSSRKPEFESVVFLDSFIHHGLALSASSGTIQFKGGVGNEKVLAISKPSDSLNLPVIGSFYLTIASADKLSLSGDFFLNRLTVKGDNITDPTILGGGGKIVNSAYELNSPPTTWSASPNAPKLQDRARLAGIDLDRPPFRPVIARELEKEITETAPTLISNPCRAIAQSADIGRGGATSAAAEVFAQPDHLAASKTADAEAYVEDECLSTQAFGRTNEEYTWHLQR